MSTVILASPCNTNNLSRTLSLENAKNLMDSSSFLSCAGEETPLPHHWILRVKKKAEEGEINVFGAEKYFNGGIDEDHPIHSNKVATPLRYQPSKPEAGDDQSQTGSMAEPRIPSRTTPMPIFRSKLSRNSQRALLQTVPRSHSQSHGMAKKFLASLGCPCNGKNSVDICQHLGENGCSHAKALPKKPIKDGNLVRTNKFEKPGSGVDGEASFSFPTLASNRQLQEFGSPFLEKEKIAFGLDRRRLMMLNWDAIPRMEEQEIDPQISNGMSIDTESDASSDLFEIESISTDANSLYARQVSGGMSSSCVTPRTGYAPSEASIKWSVVTDTAADFSVASDSEEMRTRATATTRNPNKMAPNHEKYIKSRRPNILLLGCKSLKAVRVAGDEHIPNEKLILDPRIRPHSFMNSFSRFQADRKVTGFDSRRRQNVLPSQPHSGCTSHLLYVQ